MENNSPDVEITPAPAKPKMAKLELLRAYWPEDDVRVDEGTVFECDPDEALTLIETGVAKRAKPDAEVSQRISFTAAR